MMAVLDLTDFEWVEARFLKLKMWVMETRLNLSLSDFEQGAVMVRFGKLMMVARLESDSLE
jgi:hypothetical protein